MRFPEKYRLDHPFWPFSANDPEGGYFEIPYENDTIGFIASMSKQWEHLTIWVKGSGEEPTWQQMKFSKNVFWEPEDCCLQYHPPESDYIDNAKTALHIWRNRVVEIPRPPSIMIGIKAFNNLF